MKYWYSILLLIILVGCDIFSTRDPELPNETKSSYVSATQKEIVIQNLINAFAEKNADDYLKSFSNLDFVNRPFQFNPSSTALTTYQNIWVDWNLSSEVQSFNNMKTLVPDESLVSLTLSSSPGSFSLFGDSWKYSSEYLLNVPTRDGDTLNFQGNVEFSMIPDSRSIFVIYFWKDNGFGDNPSWSDLKGSLY